MKFKIGEETYNVLIGTAEFLMVETCLLLAEKSHSGIGILFNYDLKTGETIILARVTKDQE